MYYILGFEAHRADVEGGVMFRSEFPKGKSLPFPQPPPILPRWYLSSLLAARHGRYVEEARRKLEQAGVPAESLERFLAGDRQEAKTWDLDKQEVWAAFIDLAEALSLSTRNPSNPLDADEATDVARERERLQLREIVSKFGLIVRRVEELDPLAVSDAQLEEATRCYLYGFHRSAVVGAAAALETHLRRATKRTSVDRISYPELIADAQSAGALAPDQADSARVIFGARNHVVHKGLEPPTKDVLELLKQARRLIDHLGAAQGLH